MPTPYADVLIELPDDAADLLARRAPHRFMKMDSAKPLLYIGGVLYEGAVRPVVGSHLLFDGSGAYSGVAELRVVFKPSQSDAEQASAVRTAAADAGDGDGASKKMDLVENVAEKPDAQLNIAGGNSKVLTTKTE